MDYPKKRIAWNKGKKCPYVSKIFKGKKLSLEHREKLRRAKLISPVRYWLGKKRPELKNTNSAKTMFKKGLVPPWTGKKLPEISGENHWNWKGGKQVDCYGYVLILNPDHPYSDSHGYIREHRLIMEKKIGRYLTDEEVVHHINHQRDDNKIENLMLFENHSQHLFYEGRIKRGEV